MCVYITIKEIIKKYCHPIAFVGVQVIVNCSACMYGEHNKLSPHMLSPYGPLGFCSFVQAETTQAEHIHFCADKFQQFLYTEIDDAHARCSLLHPLKFHCLSFYWHHDMNIYHIYYPKSTNAHWIYSISPFPWAIIHPSIDFFPLQFFSHLSISCQDTYSYIFLSIIIQWTIYCFLSFTSLSNHFTKNATIKKI